MIMRQYTRMLYRTAACLIGAALLFASCEKSDNNTEGLDIPDSTTRCLLQPPTIGVMPFGAGSPVTRAVVAMKEEQQAFNVGEELGNIITLGNSPVEETPQTRTLTSGAYCRIVVYKLEDWNSGTMKVLEQRLCKQGSTDYFPDLGDSTEPIYLYPGSYKIFCYSFNKTTTDKMAKLTNGTLNVPLSDGDDFMSVVIEKTIIFSQLGTNVALGAVTLQHRCCRLIGTLKAEAFENATGIAASPIPSLGVTSTFTTSGNWSIKGNSFTGSATSIATKHFTLSESGNDYMGVLMLLPLTKQALTTSYTFLPNGAATNVTASNRSISSSATFASNGSYSFTIKAIGAYVLTDPIDGYVQIGDYKWAYANLNGSNKKQETYPWVSGNYNGSDNDYWRWNMLDIDISEVYPPSANTWSSSTDPCKSGLRGNWKVPPLSYFENLIEYGIYRKRVYIKGLTMLTDEFSVVSGNGLEGCVFVDPTLGTCIFLPACGSRKGASIAVSKGSGVYWTSTKSTTWKSVAFSFATYRFGKGHMGMVDSYTTQGLPLRCAQ